MDRRTRNVLLGVGSALGGVLVAGGVLWATTRRSGSLPPGVVEPKVVAGVPFATGGRNPQWPVLSTNSRGDEVAYQDIYGDAHGNWERRFGAYRDDHTHAGIDLYGTNGDVLVATEDGTIVSAQTFHLGTDAILLETRSGLVVLYGEVDPGSWKDFGVQVGSRVRAGQPIATIGCMVGSWHDCTSHMLHLETYVAGVRQNKQWHGTPPAGLLDPTRYLLRAMPNVS